MKAMEVLMNDANLGIKNWVSNAKEIFSSNEIDDNDSKFKIK